MSTEVLKYRPDNYLTGRAATLLGGFEGRDVGLGELAEFLTEMRGFEDYPEFLQVLIEQLNRLGAEIGADRFPVEDVVYDEAGLVGLKFSEPRLRAMIIHIADPGRDNHFLAAFANDQWYTARPHPDVGAYFDFEAPAKIPPDSRTYAIMKQFDLEPEQETILDILKRLGLRFERLRPPKSLGEDAQTEPHAFILYIPLTLKGDLPPDAETALGGITLLEEQTLIVDIVDIHGGYERIRGVSITRGDEAISNMATALSRAVAVLASEGKIYYPTRGARVYYFPSFWEWEYTAKDLTPWAETTLSHHLKEKFS